MKHQWTGLCLEQNKRRIKMQKLTKVQKERIREEVIKNKVTSHYEKLKRFKTEAAIALLKKRNEPYLHCYASIPEELVPFVEEIQVTYEKFPDKSNVVTDCFDVPKMLCSLPYYKGDYAEIILRENPAEILIFQGYYKEYLALMQFEKELRTELCHIINPITSLEKLLKIMPEIKDWCNIKEEKPFYPLVVTTDKAKFLLEKQLL